MDKSSYLDFDERGENAVVPGVPICIILLTYKRTDLAIRTIRGICEHLVYPNNPRGWYVADDGSSNEHFLAVMAELHKYGENVIGHHHEKGVDGTSFCGRGWNEGLRRGHQFAPVLLWLEDDWELRYQLDLRPYVRMLMERQDVGIIRMGGLAVGSECRIVGHNGIHYLNYLRTTPYAYSGNPMLRHIRFSEYYGTFAVDRNPGDIELHYDEKYRLDPGGPEIWRPVDMGGWGLFGHIGTEKSW